MKDHRIEVYVDAATYLALIARSEQQDRSISQHVRHLIRVDLEASVAEIIASRKGRSGGSGPETHAEES